MLEFRVLGPLEVWRDGERVPVAAARERAVLAALLLQANQVLAADRLIELLWGESPPAKARSTVHTWVWRLRRRLEPPTVFVTRPPGYQLCIDADQLDLLRFEALLRQGRQALAAAEVARAAQLFGEALALWRGEPLADVAAAGLRRVEGPRLSELHLQAVDAWVEAELRLGRHDRLIGELRGLISDHPMRERLSEHLMLALYRGGRQAEALQAYRTVHRVLAEELGVEPGPALQRLHEAVLRADPALDLSPPTSTSTSTPTSTPVPVPTRAQGPTRAPATAPATTTAPTALAPPHRPAQLPADVSAFVGRTDDLQRLDGLLTADEAATAVVISAIAGTAGVGKTALAVHWAHRVRDRFPDGQLFVNLRGYATGTPMRPVEALSRFLRVLGVPAQQVPLDVEEAADLYRTLLADKRVLILLDNAHRVDQVRPLLPGSPGCLVLVTSRDRLGGLVAREGAHRLSLDVLAPADASALLSRIIGADRVAGEASATTELAELCAHLPLALRIAAANLTDHPGHSIARYVAELREGNRLAALAVDGDDRAAVRAAFDLSYQRLEPDAQRLFGLLGLTPGPDITAEAAAALSGTGVRQAVRSLERLTAAHLLDEHTHGRYACHDLLRRYAAEHAHSDHSDADQRAAAGRLYDFYLHTVDTAAGLLYPEKLRLPTDSELPPAGLADWGQALVWLDAERANLVAVIRHAAEHGPRRAAWLLADALRGYFNMRMYTVDWLTVARAGLVAAQAEGEPLAEAAAHISLADLHFRQSRHVSAIDHQQRALALTRRTGWLDGQAGTLGNLGLVYQQAGRLEEATEHLQQALKLNREFDRTAGQAANLTNLGLTYLQRGRLAEAADHTAQALALYRKIGSRAAEADLVGNLGEICHMQGQLDEALDYLTQAWALCREIGSRGSEAEILRCLAAVHRDTGRLEHAMELLDTALTIARETGNRRQETDLLNTLGTVQHSLGNHDRAFAHHRRALQLAPDTTSHYPEADALLGLAAAELGLGDHDNAVRHADRALAIAHTGGYRLLEGHALNALAAIDLDRNNADDAVRHAGQALAVHRETGHCLGHERASRTLAEAQRLRGP